MSPSWAKNSSSSMPWIWTGTPSGHGPKAHSPVMGTADSKSSAPAAPGRVWASRWACMTPKEKPGVDEAAGSAAAASSARASKSGAPSPCVKAAPSSIESKRAAAVQVGGVHGVASRAELVGEPDDAGGQALDVVEEEYVSHGTTVGRVPDVPRPLRRPWSQNAASSHTTQTTPAAAQASEIQIPASASPRPC